MKRKRKRKRKKKKTRPAAIGDAEEIGGETQRKKRRSARRRRTRRKKMRSAGRRRRGKKKKKKKEEEEEEIGGKKKKDAEEEEEIGKKKKKKKKKKRRRRRRSAGKRRRRRRRRRRAVSDGCRRRSEEEEEGEWRMTGKEEEGKPLPRCSPSLCLCVGRATDSNIDEVQRQSPATAAVLPPPPESLGAGSSHRLNQLDPEKQELQKDGDYHQQQPPSTATVESSHSSSPENSPPSLSVKPTGLHQTRRPLSGDWPPSICFIGGLLLSLLATTSTILYRYLRSINEGFSIGFTSVLIIVGSIIAIDC
ncbi:hypothetical protein LWI29_008206 [Acer saccharum]|uniref:Uncharacterized protein n=1 Tax=Acer saccharum TaxID=4024 RepID=A0AA39SRE9_ACESA|nr:hypothetical protein LWI29_008206 [Acer saccharum]